MAQSTDKPAPALIIPPLALTKNNQQFLSPSATKRQLFELHISHYNQTLNKYQSYLSRFPTLIDKILQKQEYRTHLSQQSALQLYRRLLSKKEHLKTQVEAEEQIQRKENGIVRSEIEGLSGMGGQYKGIKGRLEDKVNQMRMAVLKKKEIVRRQKMQIKISLKDKANHVGTQKMDASKSIHSDCSSYDVLSASKTKKNILHKLSESHMENLSFKISHQHQKLMLLRLLCLYLEEEDVKSYIQSQKKWKEAVLAQIKGIWKDGKQNKL